MITLYGIEFPDDEVDVATIDGRPEWIVNSRGARRVAQHAPDQVLAARFLAWLESQTPLTGGGDRG